ncbi:hypothetical protein GRI94_08910 [Erythrobacter jejuensis]|uniref:Uncharacterized protein n=1 Tax=Parerythrobacter jejuensis TaxID=795812 RepID=A0A845ASX2_9SPHN|nr:hypothetical protein [Parerythrobacter jejuensis]
MFSFILIIASIALGVGSAIHRRSNEHEERKLELLAKAEEAKSGRGASSEAYRKLEERVRVLERIATDRQPDLAAQIEQLRDVHDVDLQIEQRERTQ